MILKLTLNNETVLVDCPTKEDAELIKRRVVFYLARHNGECDDLEALISVACNNTNSKIPDLESRDLECLLEEFKERQEDPLIKYLKQEVEYRLKEFHEVSNPTENSVNEIANEIGERLEEVVDFENLDKIIREMLHK